MSRLSLILLLTQGLSVIMMTVLFGRIRQYRKQIRSFAKMTSERMEVDMDQTISVDYFGKDIVRLAIELNKFTDMRKEQAKRLREERHNLDNIIAGISHDFRTPLTAAMGYLQMLAKNSNLDGENREFLEIAMSKTRYLKELSDEFFELSKLTANEEMPEMESINLVNLLSEHILAQYQWVSARGIRMEVNIPENDIFITGNEKYLNRIFENLFSNAAKYAMDYLSLTLEEEDNRLVLSMQNGMNDAYKLDTDRIFEAFYRHETRNHVGTGLGLYVVKCMAQKMGYEVMAECHDGEFKIDIIMCKSDARRQNNRQTCEACL